MPFPLHVSQIYALATVALWSSAYVFTRVAVRHFSMGSLSFIRCAVATFILAVPLLMRKGKMPRLRDIPLLFLSGAFGFSLYLPFFNKGLETLSATTSCVIVSTAPILTALGSALLFKESLPPGAWGGIGLGFCGVAALMLWNGVFALDEGALWTLGAAFFLSAYNLLQRRLALRFSPLEVTGYSFSAATLSLLPCAQDAACELFSAPLHQVAMALFLGVFPSAVAYALWTKGLSLARKTSEVANFMFLTPFLALLLGYAVITELPGTETFVGGAMILCGLAWFNKAVSGPRNRA